MNAKKKVIAMLLAGGQGSRLYALTQNVAKPAVPYGGKYRIIDFALSNCTNSGIDTVGVLTQYQPLVLNEYIGNGQPWDLDRMYGGVHVLSPFETKEGADWFQGTANAIYQNMKFIERYDPEYVIVLGGDHIYKMDYSKMVEYHEKNNADGTIAVIDVPMEEASRFGIMTCDAENRVVRFTEKPKNPESTLASMGIYCFTWEKLKKYLIENENANTGSKDFGKDIIPSMLHNGERLFAYTFDGYWKDVGTIESLWESNMDLLTLPMPIDLSDKRWRIFARNPGMPPHYIADGAKVDGSLITEGCEVKGVVKHSVLFAGVTVETGAEVTDAVVMPGAVIERGAIVKRAIVAENAHIAAGAVVGEDTGNIAVVGPGAKIAAGEKVAAGVQVDADLQ